MSVDPEITLLQLGHSLVPLSFIEQNNGHFWSFAGVGGSIRAILRGESALGGRKLSAFRESNT